jgi:hypothetical protein
LSFESRILSSTRYDEEVGELAGFGQVEAVALLAVLEEDGGARVLEDGVVERVALGDLLADLGVEVVVGVLGLPEAAAQVEQVAEGAVGVDVLALGLELELGQ